VIGYGKVETKLDRDLLLLKTMEWAEQALIAMSDTAIDFAQMNVYPNVGPGPHPHKVGWWTDAWGPREDTGNLHDEIIVLEPLRWKGRVVALAFGNTQQAFYGLYLEEGWTTKQGTFWRYPWLWPATLSMIEGAEEIMNSIPKVE